MIRKIKFFWAAAPLCLMVLVSSVLLVNSTKTFVANEDLNSIVTFTTHKDVNTVLTDYDDYHTINYANYGEPCGVFRQCAYELFCQPFFERCDCYPPLVYNFHSGRCQEPSCYDSCYQTNHKCINDICTEYVPGGDFSLGLFLILIGSIIICSTCLPITFCICRKCRKTQPILRQAPSVHNGPILPNRCASTLVLPPNLQHIPPIHVPITSNSVKFAMDHDSPPTYFEAVAMDRNNLARIP